MAGLGFANPERKRAEMLARLNGSTSPIASTARPMLPAGQPMPGGTTQQPQAPQMPQMQGAAPPDPSQVAPLPMPQIQPQQPMQPTAPAAGQPGEEEDDGPAWHEVIGALGHVILSADAGYRGAAMPENPLAGDQDQEMQVQQFIMNTAARGWEAIRQADPENRPAIMKTFADIIRKVDPNFDYEAFVDGLMSDPERVDQMAPQIAMMSDEAKEMFMARVRSQGGDPAAAAAEVIKDPDFMKTLTDFDDSRNMKVMPYKLERVKAALVSMGMDPMMFANMTPEEFARVNNELPEKARLTPAEIATLRRQPTLGKILGLRYADEAPEGGAPSMDDEAGYRPPSRPQRPSAVMPDEEPMDGEGSDAPPPRAPASPRPSARPASPPAPPPARGPSAQRPAPGPQAANPGVSRMPAPARPAAPAKPPAKPPARTAPAKQPYYPPGFQPRTPKPRQEPVPVTKVEVVGKRPPKKAQAPETQQEAPRERRVVIPKDTEIPGFGKVKKGEVLVYDYKSGTYRRAK